MKRLESGGAIENYAAVLNHKVMGVPNIVFVQVTLDKHDERILEQFGAALGGFPEIMEAYLGTGEYDSW